MKKTQRMQLLKDFIQEAIERGADSVQAVHKHIAALPFDALEEAGLLNGLRTGLKKKHLSTIDAVYDTIRGVNREIGQLISDQIENIEETLTAASRIIAEPKPIAEPAPAPVPKPAPEPEPAKPAVKKVAEKKASAPKAVQSAASKAASKKSAAKKQPRKK